jgi:hypothetical protein
VRQGRVGVGATRGGRRSTRRGPDPDRWGTTWVAQQRPSRGACGRHVCTGEAPGSLMCGTQLTAREGGRREAWGACASPKKKERAEPG